MTAPLKDNAHIQADQAAFVDAFQRARGELGRIDGVVGVGLGHKETGGEFTDDVSITVFVREKKPDEQLSPAQRVPPTFEGYRTDVRIMPQLTPLACDNKTLYATIRGGIQIEARSAGFPGTGQAGTLGCIVRKRGDEGRENVHLLTCAHVLQANFAKEGSDVYHPFLRSADGSVKGVKLGPIEGPLLKEKVYFKVPDVAPGPNVPENFYVDCATARIDIDSRCIDSVCSQDSIAYEPRIISLKLPGEPANEFQTGAITGVRSVIMDLGIMLPRPQDPAAPDDMANAGPAVPRVFKVGRSTGWTTGIVRNTLVSGEFHFEDEEFPTFVENIIEIDFDSKSTTNLLGEVCGRKSFGQPGDSGSIVVDRANMAIGLLFAGSNSPNPTGSTRFRTYACHIMPVLDQLKICIPTPNGTTHGCCGARDGSGTAAHGPLGDPDLLRPMGQTLFTSVGVGGRRIERIVEPAPVTEAQQVRLFQLRDALRESVRGRELHESFAEVRREMGYLVRNCRPVKVVWHRNRGPAFLAHVLNHLRGDTDAIPREIGGVARATLLVRMGEVLAAHGSHPLRDAIARHGPDLLMLAEVETMRECIAAMHRADSRTVASEESVGADA